MAMVLMSRASSRMSAERIMIPFFAPRTVAAKIDMGTATEKAYGLAMIRMVTAVVAASSGLLPEAIQSAAESTARMIAANTRNLAERSARSAMGARVAMDTVM